MSSSHRKLRWLRVFWLCLMCCRICSATNPLCAQHNDKAPRHGQMSERVLAWLLLCHLFFIFLDGIKLRGSMFLIAILKDIKVKKKRKGDFLLQTWMDCKEIKWKMLSMKGQSNTSKSGSVKEVETLMESYAAVALFNVCLLPHFACRGSASRGCKVESLGFFLPQWHYFYQSVMPPCFHLTLTLNWAQFSDWFRIDLC